MIGQDTVVHGQEQVERQDFARIPTIIDLPNLIEVQQKSYGRFLQQERPPLDREDRGLEAVFRSVFPIADFNGVAHWNMLDMKSGYGNQKKVNIRA
jgi:DNA-directed RNA polymerase subunit beta